MSEKILIGIDTSNYTTSLALMTQNGELLANIKRPLPVKPGECGLRQSDAVFAHVKNIPSAMQEAKEILNGRTPVAIGVSTRPRNIDGSYMPCFLSGVAAAESISAMLNVPIYYFSHQCGHIMAALYSSGNTNLMHEEFVAFHVSGGTTDMLRVRPHECGFVAERVGGTADLNAGQAIDRIGVAMGMSFPCGAQLEKIALENTLRVPKKKPKINDMQINLSGLENLALKLYKETDDKSLVSAFAFDYIYNGIALLADAYVEKYGNTKMIFSGGVMSNSIIRKKLEARYKGNAFFAEPAMSADNAVGIAYLALVQHSK